MQNMLQTRKHISRKDYWDHFFNAPGFEKILKDEIYDREEKIALFLRFVYVVNVELSAACNRRCAYCPISLYPREQAYMKQALFEKIFEELRQISYKGTIMLNMFNEPLMDENLTEKIHYIRNMLPNVFIIFNSNGDFLTPKLWKNLAKAGLNQINVTLHTSTGGGVYG